LTIAYQRGDLWRRAPTMWETLTVPRLSAGENGYRFHVHARRFSLEDLPRDDEDLAKWLERRWMEKGDWLERKRIEWATRS
jgi:hypothetical protein